MTYVPFHHDEIADALDDARDEARARIHKELVAEFRSGFSDRNVEMRHAVKFPDGRISRVGWISFHEALQGTLDDLAVSDLFMDAMANPSADALRVFMAAAAEQYAFDHADDLAEIDVELDMKGLE